MISPKELPSRWSCCSKKDAAGLCGNYQTPVLLRAGPEAPSAWEGSGQGVAQWL